jgi:hypothetical protein
MTRPKGSKNKVHGERLIVAVFKIRKATWSKFCQLYPRKTSLIIRQFVEEYIKNAK